MKTHRITHPTKALIQAYHNDTLIPGQACYCFWGNAFGNSSAWHSVLQNYRHASNPKVDNYPMFGGYSIAEIDIVERCFENAVNNILKAKYGTCDRESICNDWHKEIWYANNCTWPYEGSPWHEFFKQIDIDLFPAVLATFNKLVELEGNWVEAQGVVDKIMAEV